MIQYAMSYYIYLYIFIFNYIYVCIFNYLYYIIYIYITPLKTKLYVHASTSPSDEAETNQLLFLARHYKASSKALWSCCDFLPLAPILTTRCGQLMSFPSVSKNNSSTVNTKKKINSDVFNFDPYPYI